MPDYFEKITGIIYRAWKRSGRSKIQDHPNEEALACFVEDKLSRADKLFIEKHLVNCVSCAEYAGIRLKMQAGLVKEVPDILAEKIRKLVISEARPGLLEIFLRLKEKAIEIIQTSGDVLVGQELIPAPVLRSRQIKDFREEVTILKDLQKVRIEARLKNNNAKSFNLTVAVRDKESQKLIPDLRVTLLKGDLELESYASGCASVIFRDILPGVYTAEVTQAGEKVAVVEIEVKS
jgi:hypothetical protein